MSGHLRGGFYIAIFVLAFESTMLFNYLGRAPGDIKAAERGSR